ncbi:MAG: UDP-N-acetylmuramoyl-L-alanyl-D-glutamate--2,6-diaminopimelate ligase [Methylococcales symbiont of Hymedesmia sp. n. MRB-2018]|nr:MAG: UDP-N-acetylmuramoyl-L-alanyl-D-glutamate--2,6-diaminopimelate ligase [Methylococcales symbiont of Hymedesmia sp. n. MRB-2018]KAF3983721.1 MAG: UDP-N-acetylmuramoyl-L-alanyl-D-glutamate--2,6-diaminopimelate ligase [Methylococcales symbiont of Hymedesmia sp. n. MRB-2018]
MNLNELLDGLAGEKTALKCDRVIKGITLDSRKIGKNFVFVAVAGAMGHGLRFLSKAIEKGAIAVVYDIQGSDLFDIDKLPIDSVGIKNLSSKLGFLADRFYQSPSKKIAVIGVTGTNGKTTCSQFLLQLIAESAVVGTLGWGTKAGLKKTVNTTPDAITIQTILANFVVAKKQTVVMEVSSHGLQQGRVNGVDFKAALFTNLSRDHLDYHLTMDAYLEAKLILFRRKELQFVVVNTDDSYSERIFSVVGKNTKCWAYSAKGLQCAQAENVTAKKIEYGLDGISFLVCWNQQKMQVNSTIVGDFNLDNILAVITVLLAQGQELNEVVSKVTTLEPVAGRMERFGGDKKPYIFVDYAHTPDALDKLLRAVKKYCQGKLWLVFGCGGDRDKGKRPEMGRIASQLADVVIIANDNPRYEMPEFIIKEIQMGCKENVCEVIQDREQAIQSVISRASLNDCVVIAGKGDEDYQEIKGVRHPFSDQGLVRQGLIGWQ